jgi:hypothetical protein
MPIKITKEEIINLRKKYMSIYKNNKLIRTINGLYYEWEYRLLIDIKAITDNGIYPNYPSMKITKSNGDVFYKDHRGDLNLINKEIENFNNNNIKAKSEIYWWPRNYQLYKEIKNEL